MNFVNWFRDHQTQVAWWTIGWLCFAILDTLQKGDYTLALIDAFLIGVNYYMWKRNQ